jgi:hypothetical protein
MKNEIIKLTGMMVQTCNLSSLEAEAEGLEFKASLGYKV